ncbi:MAG: hypothetical protein EPN37_04445 [Chitinophagaceae bacterium]|nr:MAG: hypothetical protein EPN37_04445 [Chitinophagaceae bacterium]
MPIKNFFNLEKINQTIKKDIPAIMAETSIEYFKHSFQSKGWDGNAWPETKKPVKKGSLMVRSGKLVNSITAKEVTPTHVIISAGNDRIPYAKVHNEGFRGTVNIPEYIRKIKGKEQVVRTHTMNMNMPKRQYMGISDPLIHSVRNRILTRLKEIFF